MPRRHVCASSESSSFARENTRHQIIRMFVCRIGFSHLSLDGNAMAPTRNAAASNNVEARGKFELD